VLFRSLPTPAAAAPAPALGGPLGTAIPGYPVPGPVDEFDALRTTGGGFGPVDPFDGVAPNDESTLVVGVDVPEPEDALDEATIVVDRRPVRRFDLVLDDGTTRLELSGERVVLGRNPAVPTDGSTAVAVPDDTRTLSKTHARLEFDGERWSVTDLDSTNGVIVVDETGVEQLLEAGTTAVVLERFVLGKVGLRIAERGAGS
ncbi:FHA domain-containing protein, partial [Agromyces seonyuensis]